jgi:hypothetical protein
MGHYNIIDCICRVFQLRQTGLIEYWQRLWYPNSECSGVPLASSHAITLMDTQSAFYLLLLGVVAAFFLLLFEFLWRRQIPTMKSPSSNGAAISLSHFNGAATMATRATTQVHASRESFASLNGLLTS